MNKFPAGLSGVLGARFGVLAFAVAGLVVLSACTPAGVPAIDAAPSVTSGPAVAPAQTATQVRDGGQVTVAVTWKGPGSGPTFQVVMDTHSVYLDSLDLTGLALLKTPAGDLAPSGWDAPRGGHHRAGALTFPATTADGSPTISTEPVELVIRNVAGVPERSFQWQP